MAVSPTDGKLYFTDYKSKRVAVLRHTDPQSVPRDITENYDTIAGKLRVDTKASRINSEAMPVFWNDY